MLRNRSPLARLAIRPRSDSAIKVSIVQLIDCLLFKTVPIYFGDPQIGRHFNPRGMIKLTNLSDLKDIIKDIGDKNFFIPDSVILENQFKAAEFLSKEHNIEKTIRFCLNLPAVNDLFNQRSIRDILDGNINLDPSVIQKRRLLPSAFVHFLYRYFYIFSSKISYIFNISKIKANF